LKTWPLCSQNPFYKILLGVAILWPLPVFTQSIVDPLTIPQSTKYPGIYESFEKIIQFDDLRFESKLKQITDSKRSLKDIKDIKSIDIDPDYMNSIMLNSKSSYLKIAGKDKCSFYNTIHADLLRTKQGKIEQIFIQYQDKNNQNQTALLPKKDFLEKVIFETCPKTKETIDKFQIKTIDNTIRQTDFNIPSSKEGCETLYLKWLEDPKTPYWCQIHELIDEVTSGTAQSEGDFKQRRASEARTSVAKIIKSKLRDTQQDFLRNFCTNADNQQLFCSEFFSTNFFAKIIEGAKPDLYIKDICQQQLAKSNWSGAVVRECVQLLNKTPEACQWGSIEKSGLSPRPRCDHLSTALNFSSLLVDYEDCPRYSDQQGLTSFARLIKHFENPTLKEFQGFCSAVSAGIFYGFNKKYNNEDIWQSSVCYFDRVEEKEKCLPTFFGVYGDLEISITNTVKEVLFRTRGAGRDTQCKLVLNKDFNPNLLEYKFGCFVVINENNCGIGQCDHRIFFNEKELKDIKFKPMLPFEYFATNLTNEKYSQNYVIQKDAKKKSKVINSVTGLKQFFKDHPTGLVHGIGCAEDLLPGFFKKYNFNQCSPLPFIVDGMISNGDRISLITRTGADNIHAPRLVSWSSIFSATKTYQFHHPVRQWTLYGLY
jgi:hypothetical protein